MSFFSLGLLLGVPLWIALLQAVGVRVGLYSLNNRQKAVIPYCGLVALGVPLLILSREDLNASGTLFLFVTSLVLSHIYFHIFNMSETARRIRILINVERGNHVATTPENYSPEQMIETRLQRLLNWGQVVEVKGRLFAKPSILAVASLIVRLHEKWLFPERF